jgi:hypothetical protein
MLHAVPPGVRDLEQLHQMALYAPKGRPLILDGRYQFDLFRKGRHIDRWFAPNIVTQEGLEYALGVALISTTQITSWYVILKDNTGDPLDGTETYATPVFTEITSYDEATRPAWTGGAITGTTTKSVDNSATPADFTISTTVTVYGSGMVGGGTAASTKGNTAGGGTLFNAANYSASKSLVDNDTLQVTYTNTTEDDGV